MIRYVKGNLLFAQEDIICQQVNCKGVMGSIFSSKNLASQLRYKYPNMYDEYQKICNNNNNLGSVQFYKDNYDLKIIANIFSQEEFGKDKQYTDYEALKSGLYKVHEYAEKNSFKVAIPYKIGCGLGGGSWKIVQDIIEEIFKESKVECVIYQFNS